MRPYCLAEQFRLCFGCLGRTVTQAPEEHYRHIPSPFPLFPFFCLQPLPNPASEAYISREKG